MNIQGKSLDMDMDMDMDGKFHIHGKPDYCSWDRCVKWPTTNVYKVEY